jgi:deoxyribose-phosphate aldolase
MAVAVATVVDSLSLGAAVADAAVMEVAMGEVMEIEQSGRVATSSSSEALIEAGINVSHTSCKIVCCNNLLSFPIKILRRRTSRIPVVLALA